MRILKFSIYFSILLFSIFLIKPYYEKYIVSCNKFGFGKCKCENNCCKILNKN